MLRHAKHCRKGKAILNHLFNLIMFILASSPVFANSNSDADVCPPLLLAADNAKKIELENFHRLIRRMSETNVTSGAAMAQKLLLAKSERNLLALGLTNEDLEQQRQLAFQTEIEPEVTVGNKPKPALSNKISLSADRMEEVAATSWPFEVTDLGAGRVGVSQSFESQIWSKVTGKMSLTSNFRRKFDGTEYDGFHGHSFLSFGDGNFISKIDERDKFQGGKSFRPSDLMQWTVNSSGGIDKKLVAEQVEDVAIIYPTAQGFATASYNTEVPVQLFFRQLDGSYKTKKLTPKIERRWISDVTDLPGGSILMLSSETQAHYMATIWRPNGTGYTSEILFDESIQNPKIISNRFIVGMDYFRDRLKIWNLDSDTNTTVKLSNLEGKPRLESALQLGDNLIALVVGYFSSEGKFLRRELVLLEQSGEHSFTVDSRTLNLPDPVSSLIQHSSGFLIASTGSGSYPKIRLFAIGVKEVDDVNVQELTANIVYDEFPQHIVNFFEMADGTLVAGFSDSKLRFWHPSNIAQQ